MSAVTVPANAAEALGMLESAMGFLANMDPAGLPAEVMAGCLAGAHHRGDAGAGGRA